MPSDEKPNLRGKPTQWCDEMWVRCGHCGAQKLYHQATDDRCPELPVYDGNGKRRVFGSTTFIPLWTEIENDPEAQAALREVWL